MKVEPLTEEAFAVFGALIRHPGGPDRIYLPAVLATPLGNAKPAVWMNAIEPPSWPLHIEKLERHPHGAQSFVPMGGGGVLVVVCGEGTDGMPDPATLRAFLCPAGTGFSYHTGTWHHGLTAVGASAEVLVVMAAHGVPGETEWFDLAAQITIEEHDLP